MKSNKKKLVVVGTGAFGTALAQSLSSNKDIDVSMYGIDQKEINDINRNHKNSKYFSEKLNKNIKATNDRAQAFKDVDIILLVVPSGAIKPVLAKDILPFITKPAYFVNTAKGLDPSTFEILSKVMKDIIPAKKSLGVFKLSGPSFAEELLKGEPTLLTLASNDLTASKKLAKYFVSNNISIIPSDAIDSVEVLSVTKNPLAIILGIVAGLGYEMNSTAFIFTKVVEETKSMVKLFGLKDSYDSIITPAGIGDLFLTGTSRKSRNFTTGFKIGKDDKVTKKTLETFATVEGLKSLDMIYNLSKRKKIRLPLTEMLYNIISGDKTPSKTVEEFFKNTTEVK